MDALSRMIRDQGFAMLDGGLATELERHGADLDDPLWSARCLIESPSLIGRVHRDYLAAGADIVVSATYQASEAGFLSRGLDRDAARELLAEGVRIAMRERDRFWAVEANREGRMRPLVAASMGPFGACLHDGSEYHGRYAASWQEVEDFHAQRLAVLQAAGADLLAFETLPSEPEAEIVNRMLAETDGPPAWVSFSCQDGEHVSHGETLAAGLAALRGNARIVAAVINCTPPRFVTTLLQSVAGSGLPLVVYPNSGETWVAAANRWEGDCETGFDVAAWYDAGARVIGGCCRTGPETVRHIRAALTRLAASRVAMPDR